MKTKKIVMGIAASVCAALMLTSCGNDGNTNPSASPSAASSFDTEKTINVVSREDGSGTRGAFIELMGVEQKDASGNKKDMTTKEAIIASKTDVMLTNVANDPYAIGYVSLGSLSNSVKALKVDGAAATAENVKSGTYKVARPFNIATKGEPSGVVKDFINFILSKEGQEVISDGYIKINDNAESFTSDNSTGKIVVGGSTSVTPIMEKLKEAYLAINTGAEIEIQTNDSTAGMTGTIDGNFDIGMASRALKDSEKAELTDTAIALDGIAVIVNPKNTIDDLTSEQIKNIYTGNTTEWSGVAK